MWRGTLAPRRVIDLVEHAPDDSALAAALVGPERRAWDLHAYLLAAGVDAAILTAWVTAQAHTKQRLAKPRPLPRPGAGPVPASAEPKVLDLSGHPNARPIPEKYLAAMRN